MCVTGKAKKKGKWRLKAGLVIEETDVQGQVGAVKGGR